MEYQPNPARWANHPLPSDGTKEAPAPTRYCSRAVWPNGELGAAWFVTHNGWPLVGPIDIYGSRITTPTLAARLEMVVANFNELLNCSQAHAHRMIEKRFEYGRDVLHLRLTQINERIHEREMRLWGVWFRRHRLEAMCELPWVEAMREAHRLETLQLNGRAPF